MSWIFCVRDHFANIPLLYLPVASICAPRTLMSSIALFRLPHNWTIPFQRFFLQFNIFTQHLACARAVAWRPVQANTLHCVTFHIRVNTFLCCFSFHSKYISLHFVGLYITAPSATFILPTNVRFPPCGTKWLQWDVVELQQSQQGSVSL